ncbi:hypothetical protein [Luteolibacter luteus]|uniref:Uncharacterized protein n=1 Tax=Luteolibacter luteus TaxID=2728835 RepID=A0A858RQW7_9BACT|nr:hypothetical protein [Luteolibacter luteus]QJE99041.1 hypothetical protein HHL09_25760 [Luteolibacter luteus]
MGSIMVLFGGLLISIATMIYFVATPPRFGSSYIDLFGSGLGGACAIVVGTGIRKLDEKSKVHAALLAGLGLFVLFPVGTILCAYLLFLTLSEKGRVVFSEDYKQVVSRTPGMRAKIPFVVWIILVLAILEAVLVQNPFYGWCLPRGNEPGAGM